MRRLIMSVLLLALVAALAVAGTAAAQTLVEPFYASPGDCYACHQTGGVAATPAAQFGVADVDYNKCRTCHLYLPDVRSYPPQPGHYHENVQSCASDEYNCHSGYDYFEIDSQAGVDDLSLTTYGFFYSTTIVTDPYVLHAAHRGLGWVNATMGATYGCSRCHAAAACSACHGTTVGHTSHALSQYPAVTVVQTDGRTLATASSTCQNPACHDPANAASASFVPSCLSCHADASGKTHAVSHTAADGAVSGVPCSACHSLDVADEHVRSSASTASLPACAACHPTPAASVTDWDASCTTSTCHGVGATDPMHGNADAAHVVADENLLCLGCHEGTELASIHAGASSSAGASSCLVCHTTGSAPASSDCTVCHFTFDVHYSTTDHLATPSAPGCPKCHSMDLNTEHANRGLDCWACHGGAYDTIVRDWNKTCEACHPSKHALGAPQSGPGAGGRR